MINSLAHIILSLLLIASSSLYASNLENRYSSINLDYVVSTDEVKADGIELNYTHQLSGGEKSGFALLLSSSSLSINKISDVDLSSLGVGLDVESTTLGIGYIFKSEDIHIIPYLTYGKADYVLAEYKKYPLSLNTNTFGILFRKAFSPELAFTFGINVINLEKEIYEFEQDQLSAVAYIGGSDITFAFDFEQSLNDFLSFTYGASFTDNSNVVSAGLSFKY